MRLGICYMVFDGEELLHANISNIREQVDFISVTWKNKSYFGNQSDIDIFPLLQMLKSNGLIDQLKFYQPDLTLSAKENELILRNVFNKNS